MYENGKVTKVISIDKTGVKRLRMTLAYNSAAKLEKVSWYFNNDNSLSGYIPGIVREILPGKYAFLIQVA